MMTFPGKCVSRLTFFLSLMFCLSLSAVLSAEDADLTTANQAYTSGDYESSARLFQQIVAARGYSSSLCFDLANAEEKAGHPGIAILNYERARYLAPGDTIIDHNLQLARKQAGLAPNSYRWWEIALLSIDWTVWLAIMGVCLVLIFLAVIGSSYSPQLVRSTGLSPRLLRTIFRGVLFVGIPFCLLMGYVELSTIGFNDRIRGVIVASKAATLRLSPFDSADSTGIIPEGELVTVEDRHDNYIRVEGRDHHFGWIRESDIAPIIAGSFDVKPGN